MIAEPTPVTSNFQEIILEAEKLCERRNPQALQLIKSAEELLDAEAQEQVVLLEYIYAFYDCFINNNYDTAIERLNCMLGKMDKELHNNLGYKLLMTLGNSQQLKGDLFAAQEAYLAGLKSLSFRRNELSDSEKLFFAAFYYNLATLLSNSELEMESPDYLDEAIKIYKEVGNKFKLSQCYVAYAQMEERRNNYNQAIIHLTEALAIGAEIKDSYIIALAKANLGALSIKISDYETAVNHFQGALSYYESNNMHYETAMLKFEIAKAMVEVKRYDEGLSTLDEAEDILMALDNKKELSEVYRLKATLLKLTEDCEQSNDYLEKYIEALKFFYDNDKTMALIRAKKEFESEKKENEARILREKNEEIARYAHHLEISNNELNQFANVASHDLREPLRMIASYIQLLRRSLSGNATEQQIQYCDIAVNGALRMDSMIKDLLRLARIDSDTKTEQIDLNEVLNEVKLNVGTLTNERSAIIHVQKLPNILADKTQMVQLFQNLIINGIKYNMSAKPYIKVTWYTKGNEIEIRVEDNGVGIPAHARESVFVIFKTMADKTGNKGTGIGLAVCKKIVDKMQGKIAILDAPEGGTIFAVTLSKEIVV